ncbi:hypothetical protein [Nocardia cyriacigeorgica]|nr:hypothetical protein [Nocardia cyriacigeorgica]
MSEHHAGRAAPALRRWDDVASHAPNAVVARPGSGAVMAVTA